MTPIDTLLTRLNTAARTHSQYAGLPIHGEVNEAARLELQQVVRDWLVEQKPPLTELELSLMEQSTARLMEIHRLLTERDALAKDAERYRWLRSCDWFSSTLAVVVNPKDSVKLGSDCPSGPRLDAAIDAAITQPPPKSTP